MRILLNLENNKSAIDFSENGKKRLLVSVSPDLKTDFGHFLNYERRIKEFCIAHEVEYLCFSNKEVSVSFDRMIPVFTHDSGHYSLIRSDARRNEAQIAEDFFVQVHSEISRLPEWEEYDEICVFLYCGSSLLASHLCNCPWDDRINLVVNAFWDFLLPNEFQEYRHVARIALQNRVKLLAMSELHRQIIAEASGLWFDWVPNPPPLLNDKEALDAVKQQIGMRVYNLSSGVKVLLPGLMTMGKGREFTSSLCEYVNNGRTGGVVYSIRDRLGNLSKSTNSNLKIMVGDFLQNEIIQLYHSSDFAVLPYASDTFRFRTSGAIVDCLVFGVIPIVLSGTWLAYICEKYSFGIILKVLTPEEVQRVVEDASMRLPQERNRLISASFRYLHDNAWARLLDVILAKKERGRRIQNQRNTMADSPFAVANRLLREGDYFEAGRIYLWLMGGYDHAIYRNNLIWCANKAGVELNEFIAKAAE